MSGLRGRRSFKEEEVDFLFYYFISGIYHSNDNLLENITTY